MKRMTKPLWIALLIISVMTSSCDRVVNLRSNQVNTTTESPTIQSECDPLASPFGGGQGTSSHPYTICSQHQLIQMGSFLDSHFKLSADLNLIGLNIAPIGSVLNPFTGSLDGNHRKISNLSISLPLNSRVGFFGVIGSSAYIKDLSFENCRVIARFFTGCVAGQSSGLLSGVVVLGEVSTSVNNPLTLTNIGGIVGRNNGSIFNSSFSGNVVAGKGGGGIAGTSRGVISYVTSEGTVSGGDTLGGIAGSFVNGTMDHAISSMSVISSATLPSNFFGGLIGFMSAPCSVSRSHSSGEVNAPLATAVGGLIGSISSFMFQQNTVRDSYSSSSVTGFADVGGLIGNTDPRTFIFATFASGALKTQDPSNLPGGLIGKSLSFDTAPVANYWDIEATGTNQSANEKLNQIQGLTTLEMTLHDGTFSYFNKWTSSDWTFENGSYPSIQ